MKRGLMKCRAGCLSLLLVSQLALADGTVPLQNLLPPPPAAGSSVAKHDLDVVMAVQQARSDADIAAAKADVERSVFRFADVVGPQLQKSNLPKVATFFDGTLELDKAEVKSAKNFWKRPRPGETEGVHPLTPGKPDDWSYPSGHATFGYTTAVLLADMVPEKRAEIFARADVYAEHRIVLGEHFPSDLEAGRLAGTVIAAEVLQDPERKAEFKAARAELRQALGLTQ